MVWRDFVDLYFFFFSSRSSLFFVGKQARSSFVACMHAINKHNSINSFNSMSAGRVGRRLRTVEFFFAYFCLKKVMADDREDENPLSRIFKLCSSYSMVLSLRAKERY